MLNNNYETINLGNDINNWFEADKFLHVIYLINKKAICIFNFENLTVLKPTGVIMLINIIEIAFKQTKQKVIIENIHYEILAYFEKIRFISHLNDKCEIDSSKIIDYSQKIIEASNKWKINFDEQGDSNLTYVSGIELIYIKNRIELNMLYKRIKEILDIWFPDKRFSNFRSNILRSMYEACDNSIEHSILNTNDGEFYLMLFKNYEIKDIEIQIVIGDHGIGIRKHLSQKYGEFSKEDSSYIEMALKEYNTGRLDDRGGMGLKEICDIIQEYNGRLVVMSSRGVVSIDDKTSKLDNIFPILGTQIEILLKYSKKYIDI